jgi:DNA helicase-2/ATP-dependent DNA helicase PcrA
MHGLWQTNLPSRFLDELPEAHVEVTATQGGFGGTGYGGGYGPSRFDEMTHFGSSYNTPGWQRAQARSKPGGRGDGFADDAPQDYDADDVAASRPPPRRPTPHSDMGRFRREAQRGGPLTIEGELVAKSTGTVSAFAVGDRVFHQKFGNGDVVAVDGNKLTIAFDKAGEKRVVDSFVERV